VPYLTPNTSPTTFQCRALLIPDDPDFVAIVTGALEELTFLYNFEQYGSLTPQQTVDFFVPMFNAFCFKQGICRMIGEIVPFAGSSNPNTNWLYCDGSSLLRSAYPDLFTVIGTVYGSVDSSHFNIPDLRGRASVGFGTGPGLSTYTLGQTGGEEQHQLTVAELAAHTHSDTPVLLIGTQVPPPLDGYGPSILPSSTGSTGLDTPHNNIQPYLAISYYIVALG